MPRHQNLFKVFPHSKTLPQPISPAQSVTLGLKLVIPAQAGIQSRSPTVTFFYLNAYGFLRRWE